LTPRRDRRGVTSIAAAAPARRRVDRRRRHQGRRGRGHADGNVHHDDRDSGWRRRPPRRPREPCARLSQGTAIASCCRAHRRARHRDHADRGELRLRGIPEIVSDTKSMWRRSTALLGAAGPQLRRNARRPPAPGVASCSTEIARASSGRCSAGSRRPEARRRWPAPSDTDRDRPMQLWQNAGRSWRSWRLRAPRRRAAMPDGIDRRRVRRSAGMVLGRRTAGASGDGSAVGDRSQGSCVKRRTWMAGRDRVRPPTAGRKAGHRAVIWMTTGLGCDGGLCAMTSATNRGLEGHHQPGDPGMPRSFSTTVGDRRTRNGREFRQGLVRPEDGKPNRSWLVARGVGARNEQNSTATATGRDGTNP